MIQVIPANRRHFADFEWLKTYWLFSFADNYDPARIDEEAALTLTARRRCASSSLTSPPAKAGDMIRAR